MGNLSLQKGGCGALLFCGEDTAPPSRHATSRPGAQAARGDLPHQPRFLSTGKVKVAPCSWRALHMGSADNVTSHVHTENRPRRDLGSCGRHGTAPAHLPPPPRGCKAVILKTTNCPLTLSIALFVTVRAITSRQEAAIYHRKHFPKLGASLES